MPLLAVAALVAGCGDDDGAEPSTTTSTTESTTTSSTTTTSVPEREPSTTTTAFDPATVEGEVEAAYLHSWDVYAHAVYHLELDEAALAEVYAGDYLELIRSEIAGRIREQRAAWVKVEHDYAIELSDAETAVVVDRYINHQVLIDPSTKRPVEDDPNEIVVDVIELARIDGNWKVVRIEELEQ